MAPSNHCPASPSPHENDGHTHTHSHPSSSVKGGQLQHEKIRKYLVLLHDCLAIKFHPHSKDQMTCHPHPHPHDPSQGFNLFKSFRDSNLSGIWNGVITEAFQHVEYRGCILPHTIFISSLPKFTQIIRNAWTRQMIRNPPGFCIQFMGEIEDVICDPIPQNQWTPLSDSLCWIILEMTSRGEEAFVETIRTSLAQATRLMVQPSRELVYQTLERLTMEQKIYQTSRGYFIVTPGRSCCWRDCSLTTQDGTLRGHKVTHMSAPTTTSPPTFSSHSLMTLDALLTPTQLQSHHHQEDRLSISRHSWDSAASNEQPQPGQQRSEKNTKLLKRHNSLKFFRPKDSQVKGSLGARSLSLRLSRSIPYGECDSSEQSRGYGSQIGGQEDDKESQGGDKKSKKGKSFLSKLFGWTKTNTNKKKKKSTTTPSESSTTASIQSPLGSSGLGLELNSDYFLNSSKHQLDNCDLESGVWMGTLDSRHHHYSELGGLSNLSTNLINPRWNSLPKRTYRSSSSRRSILTLAAEEDVGSLYATPTTHGGHHKTVSGSELSSPPPSQTVPLPFHHQRPPSGRSSTSFSQGTSLGYGSGSQGPQSHSPCSSLSTTATHGPYATGNNVYSKNNYNKRRYSGGGSVYSPTLRSDSSPIPFITANYGSRALYETIGDKKGSSITPLKDKEKVETTTTTTTTVTDPGQKTLLAQKKLVDLGHGGSTTTTLTQNVTSRTNLELELLVGGKLRVGKEDRGQDQGQGQGKNGSVCLATEHRNNQDMSVSIGNTEIRLEGPKGDLNGGREVKTIVNQNGIISVTTTTL